MNRARTSNWPVRFCLTGLLALLAACVGDVPPPTGPLPTEIESSSQAVFGGQTTTTCQFPTAVLLSGCTGTLVHPQIVITAAHCGTKHKMAIFGETSTGPRKVAIESCKTNGNGNNAADDYAYCKLVTPVTDVPIAPPLMGCEVDQLKPGRPIVLAGFGDADDKGNGFGRKRWLATVFNKIDRGAANVAGMGVGDCFGDSGGPAFVKLDDGSWRSFGIDSEGRGASCGAGDLMGFMHNAVAWIEKNSGIDITPCHDADGTWNPGPNCHGFAMNPSLAGRNWDNGCAEPTLSPPSATCGAAYAGAGNSDAAPSTGSDAASGDGTTRDPGTTTGSGGGSGSGSGPDAQTGPAPTGSGGAPAGSGAGGAPPSGSGGGPTTGPQSGGRGGSASGGAGPGTGTPSSDLGGRSGGGCSMSGPTSAEDGTAALAAIAFALAFVLRRRWFARAAVVDPAAKMQAGGHED